MLGVIEKAEVIKEDKVMPGKKGMATMCWPTFKEKAKMLLELQDEPLAVVLPGGIEKAKKNSPFLFQG